MAKIERFTVGPCDLFYNKLTVVIGDYEDCEPWLYKQDLDTKGMDQSCARFWFRAPHHYMWLCKKDQFLLTHELVHLIMDMLDRYAIPISNENQETFAYLYAMWFDKVDQKW